MVVIGPDGREYDFPEGTTKEKAIAYFKKQAKISPAGVSYGDIAPPKRKEDERPDVTVRNILQSIGQGVSLGWSDEITSSMAASLASLLDNADYREAYDDIIEQQRREGKEFATNYPGLDVGLQLAGGLLTGKGVLDVTRAAAKPLAKVVPQAVADVGTKFPRAKSLMRNAAESAVIGAGAGAGYADEDKFEGAVEGAEVGGALGAVVPSAIGLAKKASKIGGTAINVLANSLGFGSGESVARTRLLEAIKRDKTTPEALLAKLREAESQGYPVSMIDFAGPNVTNLAERLVKRSGEEYKNIVERHSKRLEELPERAKEALSQDLVLSQSNKTFFDVNRDLDKKLAAIDNYMSQSLVTERRPLPTLIEDKLKHLVKGDGDFRDAFKRSNELLKGRPDIDTRDPEQGLAKLYYLKKGLDSMIESKRKPLFDPEVANRLEKKSKAVDDLLREMSGAYSSQADFISDLNRQRQILNLGNSIRDEKMTPDKLRGSLSIIKNDDDKILFLTGVKESALNSLGKDIGKGPMEDIVFGAPSSSIREKMEKAYSLDPEDFDMMLDRIKRYDTMSKTSSSIPKLAHSNPLSAVLDPEYRDVTLALGGMGLSAFGLPHIGMPIAAYGMSRLVPAPAAQMLSKSVYGPLSEAESMLTQVQPGPLSLAFKRAGEQAGRFGVGPSTYGVLPQIMGREPSIEDEIQ